MDIHANILFLVHWGAPFRRSQPTGQAYPKGAPPHNAFNRFGGAAALLRTPYADALSNGYGARATWGTQGMIVFSQARKLFAGPPSILN